MFGTNEQPLPDINTVTEEDNTDDRVAREVIEGYNVDLDPRMGVVSQLTDADLELVYKYVDAVPLTKPKKNIARDFSDGSQAAILIKHYLPKEHKTLC